MEAPVGIFCVIPSRLAVNEPFQVKVKVLGPVRRIEPRGAWCTRKPALHGPYNLNVQRGIHYVDNVLPEWQGRLAVKAEGALQGPCELRFDGSAQGVFPGDKRPIAVFEGFVWQEPGFHFLHLRDPDSGVATWSNPVYVSSGPPEWRLVWGDPHWQTFFSDGIRCPEELYAFARDEGFLDFGALSDHMEGVTDRQWDYFQAVTNDVNEAGRFVALQGQEWTHHNQARGAPGHRNIYYRGEGGPVLRSRQPECDTLEKLWARLDEIGLDSLAVPHHSANKMMGVDWEQGWNERYEKAVEIYSVWGNSEKPEDEGNPRPIRACGGELKGRHVRDALARGFRLGFMGGGDVHDGRPGDTLHAESYPRMEHVPYPQGLTAACVPQLTREHVFDAIRDRRTYATTRSRIYLDTRLCNAAVQAELDLRTASEDGIARVVTVRNGEEMPWQGIKPGTRAVEQSLAMPPLDREEYIYVRVETTRGELAWSSPVWG